MTTYTDKELRRIEKHLVTTEYALAHAPLVVLSSYRQAYGSGSVGIAYVQKLGWYVLVTAGQGPVVVYPSHQEEESYLRMSLYDINCPLKSKRAMQWAAAEIDRLRKLIGNSSNCPLAAAEDCQR